jgi:hypothetical protein
VGFTHFFADGRLILAMCDVDVVGSGIACGLAFAVVGRIQDAVTGPEDKPVRECECSTGKD